MEEATLCYIVDDGEVLLIEKLRGLGSGLYNGPGGKIEPGETPREAIQREVSEEVNITVVDPTKVGELTFYHDDRRRLYVHVFRADEYRGDPAPSSEAEPAWFPRDDLPYDRMWEDDSLWLPLALSGDPFVGRFDFVGGDSLDDATFVDHEIDRVETFDGRGPM